MKSEKEMERRANVYSIILDKFLEHPKVKEYIEKISKEDRSLSKLDAIIDAIKYFFDGEYEVILQIDELFKIIVEAIKYEVDAITINSRTLIYFMDTSIREIIDKYLEEISLALIETAEEKYS